MRYLFDRDSNSLAITLAEGRRYRDSQEIVDGVVVDFDTEGVPYAIEFLRADRLVDTEGLVSGRPVRLGPQAAAEGTPLTAASLKRWRERLEISREELAARLGVGVDLVEEWENGGRPIPNAGILRLALQAIEGNAHEHYLRQSCET